ncbi:MAG TPA: cytochrome C, partial [Desulfuromonadales bacterium]|nr:cytochrome C [Desulfuromonadales bacterium]
AKLDLINRDSCTRCHDYGRAGKIKEILADTDARIQSLEQELNRLSEVGTNVDEYQGQLFSLRNRFHRAFHTVKVERILEQTGPVLEGLDSLREEIAGIESSLGQRKFWGSVTIALLVVASILFFLMRKTYEEEEKL